MKTGFKVISLAFPITVLMFFAVATLNRSETPAKKVVILGIDGMDPEILKGFAEKGLLPNFSKLMASGEFKPLETTMPPLSPVAWSTFITGTDPGGHSIFDFIHRDPKTVMPEFAMAKTIPSDWSLTLGSWVIPLRGGRIESMRQGRAFWELLEESGVRTAIYRMPSNFPPKSEGHALSGMGTPDILGTPGTFSFYTDQPPDDHAEISGGRVFEVSVRDSGVAARLIGPENSFRTEGGSMTVGFEVFLDPEQPVARFLVQDQEFVLREGEWSDWVRIDFEALPHLVSVSAIGRFYLQQVRPGFKLYVTPLQINPEEPAMPISVPDNWSAHLQGELGYFYTQELPEDTKAFSAGIFTGHEFWEQSQFVFRESRKALDYALRNFKEGLLFFYFSSIDQGSHMMWSYSDEKHPGFRPDEKLSGAIRVLYQQMDEVLGRVMGAIDDDTTLIVMSDHGFNPFYWEVNLNSWLAEKGYVQLKDITRREGSPLYQNVDWSRTEAYALGLNGIYVNLRGRESKGVVSQGAEYERLLDRLEADLLAMEDARTGNHPVTLVVRTRRDLKGAHAQRGPDLIVGYNRGYRSSWKSPLGEFPREIFSDNHDAWSGDHSVDYRLVPGILLTNRAISLEKPALYDLTVGVLDEFGVKKLPEMIGEDCLD
jgi:predicted AlkP superfamily phosphohydrolase/phosphomutase